MAPTNASYLYVIYPFLKGDDAKSFGNKAQATDSFEIMRADGTAHIVLDKETSTTGYSIFEADQDLESGLLKEVSSPSLLMLRQEDNNNLTISAVEPDLNFVKRVKGSHKAQYSLPVELTITIKGKWTTAITDKILSVDNSTDVTVITMQCKDGFSNKFNLTKLKGI
jgi:chondroitin-sulfate-ABC endolyase/exolyase